MVCSKVTVILLNGWILPIGGASAVKGQRLEPAQQACFINLMYFFKELFYVVERRLWHFNSSSLP